MGVFPLIYKAMSMYRTRLSLLFFIILLEGNHEIQGQVSRKQSPVKINFEAVVKQDIKLNLSEIVDEIEYIPLETSKDCLLGEIGGVGIFKDQIFLISNRQVFKFNTSGKFIRKIGSEGKGPGEYNMPLDIQIDEKGNSIFVLDQTVNKIHEYSTDGVWRKSIVIPVKGHPWQMLCFENSILIFNQVLPPITIQLYKINKKGEVIYEYPVMSELKGSSEFSRSMDYASFMKGNTFLIIRQHGTIPYTGCSRMTIWSRFI